MEGECNCSKCKQLSRSFDLSLGRASRLARSRGCSPRGRATLAATVSARPAESTRRCLLPPHAEGLRAGFDFGLCSVGSLNFFLLSSKSRPKSRRTRSALFFCLDPHTLIRRSLNRVAILKFVNATIRIDSARHNVSEPTPEIRFFLFLPHAKRLGEAPWRSIQNF